MLPRSWSSPFLLLFAFSCTSVSRSPQIGAEISNNRVFVSVRVNDSRPLPFLLDTGASESVLNSARVAELGLTASGGGAAAVEGGTIEATNVADVSFTVGAHTLPARSTAAIPLTGVEAGMGRKIYGILGGELFRRFVVTIDYTRGTVALQEPSRSDYRGGGWVVPIVIEENTPIAIATVDIGGVRASGDFQIDLGGGIAVLNAPFLEANPKLLPDKTLQVSSGSILPGRSRGGIGRIDAIELGSLRIEKPLANFSQNTSGDRVDVDAGLIGGEILSRFKVIVDYSRERVILEPNVAFRDAYEFSMSGLSLAADVDDFSVIRIRSVIPASPAAEAGLQPNDRVISVDRKTQSIEELRRMMMVPNKTFTMVVEREGRRVTTKLTTRRMI